MNKEEIDPKERDINDKEFWEWWDSLTEWEKDQEIGR